MLTELLTVGNYQVDHTWSQGGVGKGQLVHHSFSSRPATEMLFQVVVFFS